MSPKSALYADDRAYAQSICSPPFSLSIRFCHKGIRTLCGMGSVAYFNVPTGAHHV